MLSRKILVVDDEAVIADICRITLGNLGYNVFCACGGEEGTELAKKIPFDLALISSMLSGLNGLDTFAMMREHEPNLTGLLITEHASLALVVEAMNKGFSGVLEKPLDSGKLISAVQEALAIAHLREENTRLKTLLPLYQLGDKFMAATSSKEVYRELMSIIFDEIHPPSISIMLLDKETGLLKIVASRGLDKKIAEHIRVKPGEQIAGWVYENGKPVILNRQTQDESQFSQLLKRSEISAAISFPLAAREKVLGVVNVSQTDTSIEYSQADIEMLSVVCGQAAMALENIAYMIEREQTVRLKALFEQYVSPEVAEVLIESQQNLMDVGEVRELTVLFADIRNFTSLVQHVPPEKLRLFLNQFFDLFTDIVFSCEGTLDKFMGDAALVIFGAPVATENPNRSAIEAATRIVLEFEKLRKKWVATYEWFGQVGVGIGISRGDVFLGNVGSSRRLDYTVIGTDVNVAQRLASDTAPGQVLITRSVCENICDQVATRDEGMRLLRGMEKAIPIYSILVSTDTTHKKD